MKTRTGRTTFAAFALPLLLLYAQGGSCGGNQAANGGDGGRTNAGRAANTSNASNASGASNTSNANAAATPTSNVGGVGRNAGPGVSAAEENANGRTGGANMNGEGRQEEAADVTWGGVGVRLTLKGGESQIEFDCAHGSLGEIAPGAGGEFSVGGVLVRESGGPVRSDHVPQSTPARYSGKISGETMTLRVSAEGVGDLDFTLTRGRPGRLRKCL